MSTVKSPSSGSSRTSSKFVLCQPLEPFSMRIVRSALRPRNVFRSSRTESDKVIMFASLLGDRRRNGPAGIFAVPRQHIRNAGGWKADGNATGGKEGNLSLPRRVTEGPLRPQRRTARRSLAEREALGDFKAVPV